MEGSNVRQGDAENLDELLTATRERIAAAQDEPALEHFRVELLGKKGAVTAVLRGVGKLPAEQRAALGARVNGVKAEIESLLLARAVALQAARMESIAEDEWADVTFVPGPLRRGHLHPLTLILREVKEIFSRIGYTVAEGHQVEE